MGSISVALNSVGPLTQGWSSVYSLIFGRFNPCEKIMETTQAATANRHSTTTVIPTGTRSWSTPDPFDKRSTLSAQTCRLQIICVQFNAPDYRLSPEGLQSVVDGESHR